jgi:uncharacterized protein YjdB
VVPAEVIGMSRRASPHNVVCLLVVLLGVGGCELLASVDRSNINGGVTLSPPDLILPPGLSFRLTVSRTSPTPTWSSANPAIATVDPTGLVTGVRTGSTQITVKSDVDTASATVEVVDIRSIDITGPAEIPAGVSRQFTATAHYHQVSTFDATALATWATDPTSIATVSSGGAVTGVVPGSAKVSATIGGVIGSAMITVSRDTVDAGEGGDSSSSTLVAVQVSPPAAQVNVGATQQFTATAVYADGTTADVTTKAAWRSSSTTVATVVANTGLVTGASPGIATITAQFGEGSGAKEGTAGIVVAPTAPVVAVQVTPPGAQASKGQTKQFVGTASYSDGTMADVSASCAWSASPSSVATVNGSGVATAVGAGTATITCTSGGKSGTATVIVTDPGPEITSLTPSSGPEAGGTQVTIAGAKFSGATAVTFGMTPATAFMVVSDSVIIADAPAGMGSENVTVTTSGGASNAEPYAYSPAPTITGLVATAGPIGGGNTVTIAGTGFVANSSVVKFGGSSATSVMVLSATQISAVVPAGSAGNVSVTVMTPNGTSNPVTYTYVLAPALSGLSPNAGPRAGGQMVTITGTGLTGATAVTFGTAAAASFTIMSDATIVATTPPGPGPVSVTVSNPGGSSNALPYTYLAPAPAIISLSPTTGTSGTPVVISGTDFEAVSGVSFGGTAASSYTVDSLQQITATAPAGTGAVSVVVTAAGGASNGATFTYAVATPAPTISLVSPGLGPDVGGAPVDITGANFTGATSVKFGTTPALGFTVHSNTEIWAVSPAGSGTVDVVVTTPAGSGTAASAFTFVPGGGGGGGGPGGPSVTVTSASPNHGSTSGGTTVIITGSGLTGATLVTFGGTSASSFTVDSDTQITAVTPSHSPGMVDVMVIAGGASGTGTSIFTYDL